MRTVFRFIVTARAGAYAVQWAEGQLSHGEFRPRSVDDVILEEGIDAFESLEEAHAHVKERLSADIEELTQEISELKAIYLQKLAGIQSRIRALKAALASSTWGECTPYGAGSHKSWYKNGVYQGRPTDENKSTAGIFQLEPVKDTEGKTVGAMPVDELCRPPGEELPQKSLYGKMCEEQKKIMHSEAMERVNADQLAHETATETPPPTDSLDPWEKAYVERAQKSSRHKHREGAPILQTYSAEDPWETAYGSPR